MKLGALVLVLVAALLLFAGFETARLPPEAGMGPQPQLPSPRRSLVPTVRIARAVGWSDGVTPVAAEGLEVSAFATGLDHPRWLYRLPNGDVLVAESNSPRRHRGGVVGWVARKAMDFAGAGAPSANRLTLLRDADGDGRAEVREVFARGLNSPLGMALVGGTLYVACTDAHGGHALRAWRHARGRPARDRGGPAGRRAQRPLGAQCHCQRRRKSAVRHRGFGHQHRRCRPRGRTRPCRHPRGGSCGAHAQALRHRPAQPQWPGVGAAHRRAVDRGQRARPAGQRPRARLPRARGGRRFLRLAVELVRRARGCTREAAGRAARGLGARARLRTRRAHGGAGSGVRRRR